MSTPPRPFNAEQLQQARQGLRNTDQPLVDKFINIRAQNLAFGVANPLATIADSDVQHLKSLAHRANPVVKISFSTAASTFPANGTQAHMVFDTKFYSQVQPVAPIAVIRFVKAAQVNTNFSKVKSEHTIPGYVHYQKTAEVPASRVNGNDAIKQLAQQEFMVASWSFDGPREQFRQGAGLTNRDEPGTKYTELPYALIAEFLIVLYDQQAKRILEVGHSVGALGVWAKTGPATWTTTFDRSDRIP